MIKFNKILLLIISIPLICFADDLEDAASYFQKGINLFNLRKYEEAIATYDMAIKFKPDYAEAYYNKGIVLGEIGKYHDAIASCDLAIKYKPDDGDAIHNRNLLLEKLRKN